MVKKGLSFDEKRERLFASLKSKDSFWDLKEIEKMGVSAGIVFQSVKDVLNSLVDDHLVESDKIGSKTIFWVLHKDPVKEKRKAHAALQGNLQKLQEKRLALESQLAQAKESTCAEKENAGMENKEEERLAKLEEMKEAENNLESLRKTLKNFWQAENCSDDLLLRRIETARGAIIRWGDNVCITRQWICNRIPGTSERDVDRQFDIPTDIADEFSEERWRHVLASLEGV